MSITDCFWNKKIGMILFKSKNTKEISEMTKIADSSINLNHNFAKFELNFLVSF